jgi:hypothetical protein
MIILFGTRRYLYQLAMITLVCGRCGNPAAHSVRRRVVKFTLFFVPLFPISSRWSTQCTFCGVEHQLPKEQAEQLLAQAAAGGPAEGQGAPAAQPDGQGQSRP